MMVHNTSIFMHNRAPCHRFKVVLKYLWKSKVVVLAGLEKTKFEPLQKLVELHEE